MCETCENVKQTAGWDGTGRDGTGRDGTGRDGTGQIFDRTDLRISLSKAKFDAGADGDVRLAVRRPKPRQISKKLIF